MSKDFEIYTLKEPGELHQNVKSIEYLIDPVTGCWNVINRSLDFRGYGLAQRAGRRIGMHCYSWELAYGSIPDGLCVLHRCDNPRCVNPEHLFLGTYIDNMQDASQKGRIAHGEAHRMSKLTEADVNAIRANRILSQKKLGRKYGVAQSQVSRIKRGRTWKYLQI